MRGTVVELPENVEQVGYYNRKPVFRETIRKPKKVIRKDADGKVMYHKDKDRNDVRPRTKIVGWTEETKEYQEVDIYTSRGEFTGTTQKNYNFRADPEDVANMEAERAAEADLKEAAVLARKHGTTLADMFRKVLGTAPKEEEPGTQPRSTSGKFVPKAPAE